MASLVKYLILSVLVAVAFAGPVKDRPKTLVPEWTSTAKLGVDPIQVKLQDLGLTLNLTAVEELKLRIYYANKTKSSNITSSYIYKDELTGNKLILGEEDNKLIMNGYINKNMKIYPSDASKGLHMVKEISHPDLPSPEEDPESETDDLEIELLMLVDSVAYERYGSDESVIKHLKKIIKDTNEAYQKLPKPIQINLKGVYMYRALDEEPEYVSEHSLAYPTHAAEMMNLDLEYDKVASRYDSIMMWTGRKMDYGHTLGIAAINGACSREAHCGIITDVHKWAQHDVLAHELGHQVGSEHDDTTDCADQIKLMASSTEGVLEWSECSVEQITDYIHSRRSHCLRTKNVPDGDLILNPEED